MRQPFRVLRFDFWYHPVMAERFAQEPRIVLETCALEGADDAAWAAFARAHVYQVTSARDELPARWRADAALLARAPQLLCVSTGGAGFDTVDIAACTAAGVLAVNQSGANAQSVAEHTLGVMIDLSRRISFSDRMLRRERGFSREDLMGTEMFGKTVGIVGIGNIGRKVARMAEALDMEVLATDPLLTSEEVALRCAKAIPLDELLARADFVSLHCPRDATTMKMMDAHAFALMKRGAFFLSTARGGIHDESALAAALTSGHLGGAGLDVWDVEPPPLDHPLLALDNVVATYHTSGVTPQARQRMGAYAADQVIGLMHGALPPRLLNPEALPRFRARFHEITGTPFAGCAISPAH